MLGYRNSDHKLGGISVGVWSDILGGVGPERYPKPTVPRPLTLEDRAGWADAQDRGHKISRKPETLEAVRKLIKHRNPVRWMQLQRDYKWVQKEMKKLGLNPEDARYIL